MFQTNLISRNLVILGTSMLWVLTKLNFLAALNDICTAVRTIY